MASYQTLQGRLRSCVFAKSNTLYFDEIADRILTQIHKSRYGPQPGFMSIMQVSFHVEDLLKDLGRKIFNGLDGVVLVSHR